MAETSDHQQRIVDQFSQQAVGYNRLTSKMASGTAASDKQAAFREFIGVHPDDRVLDVCCGNGLLALDLAPHVAQVTGFDLTPAMLEQAHVAQAAKGIANVEWTVGDAGALPFADDTFSLVTCSSAFHHAPDARQIFTEMVRVCQPDGRIVVRDVTPAQEKSAAFDRMEILRDPSHTHALTLGEIIALGDRLPVDRPRVFASVTADVPLSAILDTSFPEACTRDDITATFLADARSGQDELGFSTRLVEGQVCVSYVMTTALWHKARAE